MDDGFCVPNLNLELFLRKEVVNETLYSDIFRYFSTIMVNWNYGTEAALFISVRELLHSYICFTFTQSRAEQQCYN